MHFLLAFRSMSYTVDCGIAKSSVINLVIVFHFLIREVC